MIEPNLSGLSLQRVEGFSSDTVAMVIVVNELQVDDGRLSNQMEVVWIYILFVLIRNGKFFVCTAFRKLKA